MDCNKSWELMMKSIDKEASPDSEKQLQSHLSLCDLCMGRYRALLCALDRISRFEDAAPANMEARVMQKLRQLHREEKMGLMPFVLSPMVVFLALLACLLYQVVRMEPIALVNRAMEVLTVAYKSSQAAIAMSDRLIKVLNLKPAAIIFVAISIAFGLYATIRSYGKTQKTGFFGGF